MKSKLCPNCQKVLSVNKFNKASRRDGYQTYCRNCHNSMQREKYKKDPSQKIKRQIRAARRKNRDPLVQRKAELKRLYGITFDDYVSLYKKQNGVCAICLQECKTRKSLSVDHDHDTMAVRGLLCNRCNRAIGMLGEDPDILERAKEYILKGQNA